MKRLPLGVLDLETSFSGDVLREPKRPEEGSLDASLLVDGLGEPHLAIGLKTPLIGAPLTLNLNGDGVLSVLRVGSTVCEPEEILFVIGGMHDPNKPLPGGAVANTMFLEDTGNCPSALEPVASGVS